MNHELAIEERVDSHLPDLNKYAEELVIISIDDAERAAISLANADALLAGIDAYFEEPIAQAHRTHKLLCERRRDARAKVQPSRDMIVGKLKQWNEEQEAIQAGALAAAEVERQRREDDVRLKAAEIAEAHGDGERAERLLTDAVPPMPVPTIHVPATPRLAGASFPKRHKATVTDRRAFARAVAGGVLPEEALEWNQSYLDGRLRRLGVEHAFPAGCGIEVRSDTTVRRKG